MLDDQGIIDSINSRLALMHAQENEWNRELSRVNLLLSHFNEQKRVLASRVSKNMRHRNDLIEQRAELLKKQKK